LDFVSFILIEPLSLLVFILMIMQKVNENNKNVKLYYDTKEKW